jgi:hypothetical protein
MRRVPNKRQPVAVPPDVYERTRTRLRPRIPTTLTAKQQRFVEEYCIDLNATQSAIRAGYSEKTAHQIGYENLRKPEIAEAVSDYKRRERDRADLSREAIEAEFAKVHLAEVDPAKIRPADKLAAGMNIAKLRGYVTDKIEHSGLINLEAVKQHAMLAVYDCPDMARAERLVAQLEVHAKAIKALLAAKPEEVA